MESGGNESQYEESLEWFVRIVQHVLGHPPTCLVGFQAERVPQEDDVWDDRVEWKLACPCGGEGGRVLGYPLGDLFTEYVGPLVFVSPLAFQCLSCERVIEIIDTDKHGYDGECGHAAATFRGEGERATFPCQSCGAQSFRVKTCFQYSHFDIIDDSPELEPVAQNYFDWFSCDGVCLSCGNEQEFGDYELG